jgi:hypothetical protein
MLAPAEFGYVRAISDSSALRTARYKYGTGEMELYGLEANQAC